MADEIRVDRERALALAARLEALGGSITDAGASLAHVEPRRSVGPGTDALVGVARRLQDTAAGLAGLAASVATLVRRSADAYAAADESAADRIG